MFIIYLISLIIVSCSSSSSSSNTLLFSAGPNSYVAFDSWRPCLNGYIRFDLRTTAHDGTLSYIDDRGKFDFFYLKLIEGKLRLLFNLGNDRQALNVNTKINDDHWHTIMIKRDGQMTILSVDNGRIQNSTITHSEDLYFGGSIHNEYQASPFYFGGIPAALERPSSGNLSSFDVYMQPRFRGQIRNVIYKNCTGSRLVQPAYLQVSGGVSLVPNNHCSGQSCGIGLCLITDHGHTCLCDDTDRQGEHCEFERQPMELTFNGKQYLVQHIVRPKASASERIDFQFKTNRYDGLLFVLMDNIHRRINIKFKQGQFSIEYRFESMDENTNHNGWWESSTKDLDLIDNHWHHVQINRQNGQVTLTIDEYHLQLENEIQIDQQLNISYIFVGGENDLTTRKFYGCLKDISIKIARDEPILHLSANFLNRTSNAPHEYGESSIRDVRCSSLLDPITFLTSSSFLSFELSNHIQQMLDYRMDIQFRFQTYSSDAILLYATSAMPQQQDFLGFDLIDGFFYLTINVERHEPFQQRFNDGQSHSIHAQFQGYQGGIELNITIDDRQNFRLIIPNLLPRLQLHTLTVGGLDPATRFLPHNFWAGAMQRGLIGCFSDLELNHQSINLTQYISKTNNSVMPKSGPCMLGSSSSSSKRECLCEHDGECRLNNGGSWSCDCSKTGFTGRRCEQAAYHLDLNMINNNFEFNTNIRWNEQINDVTFGLQAIHDKENFMQLKPCRTMYRCDSIDFSIRNGLLQIDLRLFNVNSTIIAEHPFLLDHQWHYVHLQRIDSKLLLHVDHHIAQQRLSPSGSISNSSSSLTYWLILNANAQIRIEDLRLHDQSIFAKFLLDSQQQVKLIQRSWKPLNAISFYDHQHAHIAIQLNDILCQECELDTIFFVFRTTEPNGILLFAHIKTHSTLDNFSDLLLKLLDGQLHLIVTLPSSIDDDNDDQINQIQTKDRFDDGHWHQISLHRASDYHFELLIDTREYNLLGSIHFFDTLYFGRPLLSDISILDNSVTLKVCLASLTLNSRSINFREQIKTSVSQQQMIRNNCFLDSQCPLRQCQNTGRCLDRMMCDCQHTSFQGRFCTDLRTGYLFNEHLPGLIFDQPTTTSISSHRISFGLVTKMVTGEILRVGDQVQIEVFRGRIRIRLDRSIHDEEIEDEILQNDLIVNDGNYHLVQFERNLTGYIRLNVDNRSVNKQSLSRMSVEKLLINFIGQNPVFRHGFQGQLYGLELDNYPIFDMISPTFQRISLTSIVDKYHSSLSSFSLLPYPNQSQDDLAHPLCAYQSYDEICTDSNLISLVFPNITILSQSLNRIIGSSSRRPTTTSKIMPISSTKRVLITSTISWTRELNSSTSNSTHAHDIPPLIVSIRTPSTSSNRWLKKFRWENSWIFIVPIVCGILLCFILALFGYIKYRRKDVGVYEVEEAQRFRPLIVELPPSPGERDHQSTSTNSPTAAATTTTMINPTKQNNTKAHKRRRKKSPLTGAGEQREFYI